jgi:multidrug transporter EmrE-like cation transporter
MRPALLLFGVLALTVYAQLVVKGRSLVHARIVSKSHEIDYLIAMFTDPWVLSGVAGVLLAGAFWMLALQRLELGFAYPFMALSFVLVPIGSMLLFGEPLPKVQMLALVLIITGVTLSALAR